MVIFDAITPTDVLQRQITVLRGLLPGVFGGESDSIHDARIATRRIRAVLPLLDAPNRRLHDDLTDRITRLGKTFGSLRDVDARLDVIGYMEARLPAACTALIAARHRDERERARRTRKLVKRLERLDIERELARAAESCSGRPRLVASRSWRNLLRRLIDARGEAAFEAVAGATGVYFPNRMHKARIALKKLRYAAEVACQTGVFNPEPPMRILKKGQDMLGELHDRDSVLDELRDEAGRQSGDVQTAELRPIVRFVEAEQSDLYRRFLRRRDGLLAALTDVRESGRRWSMTPAAVAAVAAAALAGVHVLRRRAAVAAVSTPPLEIDTAEAEVHARHEVTRNLHGCNGHDASRV